MPINAQSRSRDPLLITLWAKWWCTGLVLFLAASIVVAPFFWLGSRVGSDFYFHSASWREAAGQWKEGIWYPRWAAGANWGFGEPRFIFYPPFSWMLGAALGSVLAWRVVPAVFVWLAVLLAGGCMFQLARQYLEPPEATLAAVLYAANPYFLLMIYRRSTYAELLAGAIFPLVVLSATRLREGDAKTVARLALAFAAVWLTNAPAAVISTYALVFILITLAVVRKEATPAYLGVASMVLGFLLAAFYIVPALFEQRWVNIMAVLDPMLRPTNNFLFRPRNTPFAHLNTIISTLAFGEISVLAAAVVLSRRGRRFWAEMWWALVVLGLASTVLMFPVSAAAWRYLPELQFVQFPWRWLTVLNLALALLVVRLTQRSQVRILCWLLIGVELLVLPGTTLFRVRQRPDLATGIESVFEDGKEYRGALEYVPRGLKRQLFSPSIPEVAFDDAGGASVQEIAASVQVVDDREGRIQIRRWGAESRSIGVETRRPSVLRLRIADYPAWRVRVNGAVVQQRLQEGSDEMLIDLPSGHSEVQINFIRTADRTISGAISATTALVLFVFMLVAKPNPRVSN